jgi:hypothetical protein
VESVLHPKKNPKTHKPNPPSLPIIWVDNTNNNDIIIFNYFTANPPTNLLYFYQILTKVSVFLARETATPLSLSLFLFAKGG